MPNRILVRLLLSALRKRGPEVWMDVGITGGAKGRGRVKRWIEARNVFILEVSPTSLGSTGSVG
jgi:hypothetical protein